MLDILDELDAVTDKPFKAPPAPTTDATAGAAKSGGKKDLWEDTDITPVTIDPALFMRRGKSFTMTVANTRDVDQDVQEKMVKVAGALIAKGYVFRHTGGTDEELQSLVMKIERIRADTYLPWKNFNTSVTDAHMSRPTEAGYGVAINNHKAFSRLPPGVRAILARNAHAILGKDLDDPVDLIIAYSPDGVESLAGRIDFKTAGDVAYYVKIATEANVPVLNFHNADAVSRLKEILAPAPVPPAAAVPAVPEAPAV